MSKEITLKDGSKAVLISQPKGIHSARASLIASGKQEFIPAAIVCQVVEIGGKSLTMEETLDLPMLDYHAIIAMVMGIEGNDL